jgi:hypothetical protein
VYNALRQRLTLKSVLFSAGWVMRYRPLRLQALDLRHAFAYSLSATALARRSPPPLVAGFRQPEALPRVLHRRFD